MSDPSRRPVLLSGIQPTGRLMIGNYLGAIRSWAELQSTHDCLFMLVDLHALTVPQVPAELRERSLDLLAQFLACGVDPVRHAVFAQSHVPAHAQLAWIMTCLASMGELGRMTQYKEKVRRQGRESNAGLFCYPVLMAADILLYGADAVPIGDDQRQHLELARDLAERFNRRFGRVFTVPEALTPSLGARIMSLRDPKRKMDKSSPDPDSYIALLDPPDEIARKIRGAVTDSGGRVALDAARPAIANLVTLYAAVTGGTPAAVEEHFEGRGYADFKRALADALVALLTPIQDRYRALRSDPAGLAAVLARGAAAARARSRPLLDRVHAVVGLIAETA